jgi:hypothetical protein
MPTLCSKAHQAKFPASQSAWGISELSSLDKNGISILNQNEKVKPEVKTILELCKASDVILGTAHLDGTEIYALTSLARETGFKKLLLTHPYYDPPGLSIKQQKELADLGAKLELCGGNLYPIPGVATLANYLETIYTIGPQSLVISSDAGQPRKSSPFEVLRVFTQCLLEKGVTQQDIDLMTKKNPAELLEV